MTTIEPDMSLESVAEHEVPRKRRKVVADDDEARTKRQERMAEVRRRTRAERHEPPTVASLKQICFVSDDLDSALAEMKSLNSIISGFCSGDDTSHLEATKLFQEQFLIEGATSVEETIRAASIQQFVEFLLQEDSPQLQIDAAWALTLIIYQTSKPTGNSAISLPITALFALVKMLESHHDDVCEQAAWALGSVAWESPQCRDLVLKKGALPPLLSQQSEGTKNMQLDSGKTYSEVRPALPTLARLLQLNDDEVLADVCWALYHIFDGFGEKVEDLQVCSILAEPHILLF